MILILFSDFFFVHINQIVILCFNKNENLIGNNTRCRLLFLSFFTTHESPSSKNIQIFPPGDLLAFFNSELIAFFIQSSDFINYLVLVQFSKFCTKNNSTYFICSEFKQKVLTYDRCFGCRLELVHFHFRLCSSVPA